MGKRVLGRLPQLIRTVLSNEMLEDLPETSPRKSLPSLLSLLAAREELPMDSPTQAGKGSLLSRLLRPEELPIDSPPADSGRSSFLGTLLSRERLPEDEPSPRKAAPLRGGRV